MTFLAPVLPYLVPYVPSAFSGAAAGGALAIFDGLSDAEGKSSFFATLARNLVIGALAGAGIPKLTSWAWALIPEATKTAAAASLASGYAATEAAFLSLPFAAQIAIPVIIAAVVIGGIAAIVMLNQKPNNDQQQQQQQKSQTSQNASGANQ